MRNPSVRLFPLVQAEKVAKSEKTKTKKLQKASKNDQYDHLEAFEYKRYMFEAS
jgi:hypothetical protein